MRGVSLRLYATLRRNSTVAAGLVFAACGRLGTVRRELIWRIADLPSGLVPATLATGVGYRLRPQPLRIWKPVVVSLCSFWTLLLLPSSFGLAASLMQLVALGLFGIARYGVGAETPAPPLRTRILVGALFGLVSGTLLVAFVGVLRLFANTPLSSVHPNLTFPTLSIAYLGGGLLAGLTSALLWPLRQWPLGAVALGTVGAVCLYSAILASLGELGSATTPGFLLLVGPTVGGPLGLAWTGTRARSVNSTSKRNS